MSKAETIRIPDDDKFSTVEINFEEPITKSEALSFWHRVCDLPKIEQQRDDLLAVCKEVAEICVGEPMNEVTPAKAKAAIAKSEVQAEVKL